MFVSAALLVIAWWLAVLTDKSGAPIPGTTNVPLPCRRIAAVYMAMRLCQLEETHSPYKISQGTPMQKVAAYLAYDPDNPVNRKLVPDINDYAIDADFLSTDVKRSPTVIVVAAKSREKKENARLVVLTDGTIRAVVSDEPLVGRDTSGMKATVCDVTPEKGIVTGSASTAPARATSLP